MAKGKRKRVTAAAGQDEAAGAASSPPDEGPGTDAESGSGDRDEAQRPDDPAGTLKKIVLAQLAPEKGLRVDGALVLFSPRPGKWYQAIVVRFVEIDRRGRVLVDLLWGDRGIGVRGVPYGDREGCWRFPTE